MIRIICNSINRRDFWSAFVPMSLQFHSVGICPTTNSDCSTRFWIHRILPLKWRILPTPCLDTNCRAALLSTQWICSISSATKNCKHLLIKMASEHPDTIECNSLSAEESATTRWVRLEAYARLLLMKCTAQLVLLLWLLLAAQSASEKVSTTQKHSAPCFQRPCPNSGGISLIPKSPEPLRYPTSFRNLCNAQRVGHDMEAATSFTLNIKSGSVPSQVQKQTHYAPESTCIFCCKAWGGIFVLDSCIARDLLNFCNTKRFLKASHHFLCCCSWHNHDSIIKFYHASFEEGDAVTCLFHHTATHAELF